jgi:hypothetical protein
LLLRIANNIEQEPNEPKYRTLKLSTNTFQNKLLPVKGAVECLFAMGFEDVSGWIEMFQTILLCTDYVCRLTSLCQMTLHTWNLEFFFTKT